MVKHKRYGSGSHNTNNIGLLTTSSPNTHYFIYECVHVREHARDDVEPSRLPFQLDYLNIYCMPSSINEAMKKKTEPFSVMAMYNQQKLFVQDSNASYQNIK